MDQDDYPTGVRGAPLPEDPDIATSVVRNVVRDVLREALVPIREEMTRTREAMERAADFRLEIEPRIQEVEERLRRHEIDIKYLKQRGNGAVTD